MSTQSQTKELRTEKQTDMVPAFAYLGNELVDMTMVGVEEWSEGLWRTLPGPGFSNVSRSVSRLVIEMPNGCLETDVFAFPGDTIEFIEGAGTTWYRCDR